MSKIEIYEAALEAIANPLKHYLDKAELSGGTINGQVIIALSKNPFLLSELAALALKEGRSIC